MGSRAHRGGIPSAVPLASLCAALAALFALAAAGGGCASAAATGPQPRIGDRALFIAPVEDRSGALSAEDLEALRGRIAIALLDASRKDEKAGRRPLALAGAPSSVTPTATLAVAVERFDAAGSTITALVLGVGTGRPGWRARVSLDAPEGPLGARAFERRSSAYGRAPGGAKAAMIDDLAAAAAGFVRRRRRGGRATAWRRDPGSACSRRAGSRLCRT